MLSRLLVVTLVPILVELHGYIENDKTWTLVLEYSPNYCDLRQFVRRYGALTEKLAKHVYIQVRINNLLHDYISVISLVPTLGKITCL